jgi:hypothetical protein
MAAKPSMATMAVSDRAFMQYLRSFGRNPKIMDLVQVYRDLKDTFDGAPVEGAVEGDGDEDPLDKANWFRRFQRALLQMEMEIDGEPAVIAIDEKGSEIKTLLRRLESRGELNNTAWRRLIPAYSELLRTVVADKDLYWAPRNIPGKDGVRWVQLRNASPKQKVVEQIRRDDPSLFERLQVSKEQRGQMDDSINDRISSMGMKRGRQRIRGRFIQVGVDPALLPNRIQVRESYREDDPMNPGKKVRRQRHYTISRDQAMDRLGDPSVVASLPEEAVTVFDDDGSVTSRDDFTAKVDKDNEAHKGLSKINQLVRKKRGGKGFAYIDPDSLRSVSREDFEQAFGRNPKPDKYVALTDDPYKSTALTKIYPVKDYHGKQIITAGRFKGYYTSDLVNRAGRLIEGSSTYYNPATGELDRREVKNDDGSVNVRKITEPYVTVDRGDLLLTLKGNEGTTEEDREGNTLLRQAVRQLTKVVPTITYEKGTDNRMFRFAPKDFAAVREAIGAMALSNAASRLLQKYFDKLAKAERATSDQSIKRYTKEKLSLTMPLRRQQAEAVAWLDANDNSGICALDTGVGKTGVAVATMQNLRRKPEIMEEGNGRFLFVCKRALKGNLPKEIYKFVAGAEADELVERTDIETYFAFSKRQRDNPGWADDYIAIFFDEAHERFKKKESAFYKAVSACKAKRKILMTASPMVRSPKEVFTLASVANGVDLNTKEGRAALRKFNKRFSETVGGRVVGIKRVDDSAFAYKVYVKREEEAGREPLPREEWPGEIDPIKTRDFNSWVKSNLFYADKRDVEDEEGKKLEELNVLPPVAVSMTPEVEKIYRKTMKGVIKALRAVTQKKYKGDKALAIEAAKVSLRKELALLTRLSDVPNLVIPGQPNPKIQEATSIIEQVQGRTLLFTDSPDMAKSTFESMAKQFPGKGTAMALSDGIYLTTSTGKDIRFTAKKYPDFDKKAGKGRGFLLKYKDGMAKVVRNENPRVRGFHRAKKDAWKVIVLQKIIQRDPTISTLTLTGTYAVGQNLQKFTTVIHLDRDDWSNETMKQRSARAWRAGQSEIVNEYTLDTTYPDAVTNDDADKTLDEIRKIIQSMDKDLFNEVVLESQVARLGEEWSEIKKQRSLLHKVDRQMMERALSPYASQLGRQEKP